MKELKGYIATAMANAEDAFERLVGSNEWVEFEAAQAAWDVANQAWSDACSAWSTAHDSIVYSSQYEEGHEVGYYEGYDAGYDAARILYEGEIQ